MSEQNIDGKITTQEVKERLTKYYKDNGSKEQAETMAVFMELYLNSVGFNVNNDMFKAHSKYYRNALVRSNYADYSKKIDVDFSFLEKFYTNLLFDGNNSLNNEDLYLK